MFRDKATGQGLKSSQGTLHDRLVFASAIYEVTYMNGTCLFFAWDLFTEELNMIKKENVRIKAKQNKTHTQCSTPLQTLLDGNREVVARKNLAKERQSL